MTPRAAPMTPDERRRAIVAAVVPLILESGTMPTTKEIARAAGVAEGTIFGVFDDKAALLMAVAEQVLAPGEEIGRTGEEADLAAFLVELISGLEGRMRRVGTVLTVLRQHLAGQPHPTTPAGPPAFVVEANQRLLDRLTDAFATYADQLAVEPRTAALALRSMVFGLHHPGLIQDPPLPPDQIARILVSGVARPATASPEEP